MRSGQAFYEAGLNHYKNSHWDLAIEAFNEAIAINPNFELGYFGLGLVYAQQFDFIKEVEAQDKAMQINSCAEFWFNTGVNETDHTIKIQAYKNAIKLNPNHVEAHYNTAHIYNKLKKFDWAIEYSKKTIALKKNHPKAYLMLGYTANQNNNIEMSIAAYNQHLQIVPCSIAWHNLGQIYFDSKNDLNEAIKAFKKAVEIYPRYISYINLARAYKKQHNKVMAFIACHQALGINPDSVNAGNLLKELLSEKLSSAEMKSIIEKTAFSSNTNKDLSIEQQIQILTSLKTHEEGKGYFSKDSKILEIIETNLKYLENQKTKEYGVYTVKQTQTFYSSSNLDKDTVSESEEETLTKTATFDL